MSFPFVHRRYTVRILDAIAAGQGRVVLFPVVVTHTAGLEADGLRVFDRVEHVPLAPGRCTLWSSVVVGGILRLSGTVVGFTIVHVATHRIVAIDIVGGIGFSWRCLTIVRMRLLPFVVSRLIHLLLEMLLHM